MAFLAIPALVAATGASATAVGVGTAVAGIGLIGAGVSAISSIKAGKAAKSQADFQADQQEQASVVAGYNAKNALANGEREVAAIQDARVRALASQEAEVGGSGITISGSAIDVMRDSVLESEKDIAQARYSAQINAYNYGADAKSLLTSSSYTRTAGANAKTSSQWTAAGDIIGGLSRAASSYSNLYNAGHN